MTRVARIVLLAVVLAARSATVAAQQPTSDEIQRIFEPAGSALLAAAAAAISAGLAVEARFSGA